MPPAYRILPLALLALATLASGGASAEPPDLREVLIATMVRAAATVHDATYTFYKQEWVDHHLTNEEKISIKQRFPHDLYMRWENTDKAGREVLYRPGWNGDQLRVNLGNYTPNLNLAIDGSVAREGERHTLRDIGPLNVVALVAADADRVRANPALTVQTAFLGASTLYGEAVHCMDMTLPKAAEPRLYAARAVLCTSDRSGLPARVEVYNVEDGALRLVERYGYANLRVNVGLTDADFSPDNPAYHF